MDKNSVSIIIPLLNEGPSIPELWKELCAVLEKVSAFEAIFVDDGSNDNTWQVLLQLSESDPRAKPLRLRVRCGKSTAYMAGFLAAQGHWVATMDGDLQDDPSDLPKLLDKARQGTQVVIGWKVRGKGPLMRTIPSRIFNAINRQLLGTTLHDINCPMRVMTKEAVNELNLYGELYRFIPALLAQRGFTIEEVPISNRKRKHGKSNFGIERFLRGFWDLLTVAFLARFREYPLHLFGAGGLFFFLTGFAIDATLTIRGLFFTGRIGHTALLLLGILLMLVGVMFVFGGFLGELVISQKRRGIGDFPISKSR